MLNSSNMIKTDPIIAVKDVEISASWYQFVFDCTNKHGGNNFAVLVSKDDDILLCLHQWNEHDHPTMQNPNISVGNGIILYFRTNDMNLIRQNLTKLNHAVEEEIHLNPNSSKLEFSVRDPDGYYLTITEYHIYQG